MTDTKDDTTSDNKEPEVCNDVKSFVPEGWEIVNQEKGDLNKDGISDVALVIQETDSEKIEKIDGITLDSNPRELIILFGKAQKDCFELNTKSETFIVAHEDEIMEDPFDGIEIKNGTLRITFKIFYSMGSWVSANYGYIWRFQDDTFKLIGANSSEFSRADGEAEAISINFSTNKYSTTTYNMFDEDQEEVVKWNKLDLKELKTFESFKAPWTWTINSELTF